MSNLQVIAPTTKLSDSGLTIQEYVHKTISYWSQDLQKSTVGADEYLASNTWELGPNLSYLFNLNKITTYPIPEYPSYQINNLEYLVEVKKKVIPTNDKSPLISIPLTKDDLPKNALCVWAYFCSMLGSEVLDNVGEMFYDRVTFDYQFATVARIVKISNRLYIMVGNSYLFPIEFVNHQAMVNGNRVVIRYQESKSLEGSDASKEFYYQAHLVDKFGYINYRLVISLDKSSNVSPDDFIAAWGSDETVKDLPISAPSTQSHKYAKIFYYPMANGFMETTTVVLGLENPTLINSGKIKNSTKWDVVVPGYLKDFPISTTGEKHSSDMVLGDIESLFFSKNCACSELFLSSLNKDMKVVIVVNKFDVSSSYSPGMQVLLSSNKIAIPVTTRNNSNAMDFITQYLPGSIFSMGVTKELPPQRITYENAPF